MWLSKDIKRGALITEYDGDRIDHATAQKLREAGLHTHIRVLNSHWLYIDGLKHAVAGRGGASFANDAQDSKLNNAVYAARYAFNVSCGVSMLHLMSCTQAAQRPTCLALQP